VCLADGVTMALRGDHRRSWRLNGDNLIIPPRVLAIADEVIE
jgi:hypothetical protein